MAADPLAIYTAADLPARSDLLLWKPSATRVEAEALCATARNQGLRAVVVPGSRVALAVARLEDTKVKTVALVGFPLGAADGDVNRFEAESAIDLGAQEIELVFNPGTAERRRHQRILRELRDVAEAVDERPVCVALETALFTREELLTAAHLVLDSGAQAIGIGTGFLPEARAAVEVVTLLREAAGPKFGIKATGPIADQAGAIALLSAGANRLGLRLPA